MPRDETGEREPNQKQRNQEKKKPRKTQNTKTHKTYKTGKKDKRSKGRERFFKNISKKGGPKRQKTKAQRPIETERERELW